MSFTFNWPRFSDQFHYDAIQMLNDALNKGNKPPVIADRIEVVELEMGSEPPELEVREIGELTTDQFRGIFRLSYSGDAHLVLKTKVQANPLNHKQPDIHLMAGTRGMLAAKQPLVVPMLLRLSHFNLKSIVVLVVSKQKGITLVFKTDPLQNVDINSTFDSIAVIQKFIQREIEGQLRQMFREDLPGIIHRLSQQWIRAKVETPYLSKRPAPPKLSQSTPNLSFANVARVPSAMNPGLPRKPSQLSLGSRGPAYSVASTGRRTSAGAPRSVPVAAPRSEPPTHDNDQEDAYDPTYGFRPEGLPNKSLFKGFGNLFSPSKGLADLAEEEEKEYESSVGDYEEDASTTYDLVDWDGGTPGFASPGSTAPEPTPQTEYETIPAVGGGVITRPRIFHSQSRVLPKQDTMSPLTPSPLRSHTPSSLPHTPLSTNPIYNPYFRNFAAESTKGSDISTRTVPPFFKTHARPPTPESLEMQSPSRASSSGEAPQADSPVPAQPRRLSISTPPSTLELGQDPKIVLSTNALNTSLHHLSTLSYSHHTLSPFTRSMQHFTVRSVPPRSLSTDNVDRQPVKAKRKRTHRIGGKSKPLSTAPSISGTNLPSPAQPMLPPSSSELDFDVSDMDRYFKYNDNESLRLRQPFSQRGES